MRGRPQRCCMIPLAIIAGAADSGYSATSSLDFHGVRSVNSRRRPGFGGPRSFEIWLVLAWTPIFGAMVTIPEAFTMAQRHHRAGRLAEAERGYRDILAIEPEHVDSL